MTLRLSLVFAALFLAVGIVLPFWPAWLKSRGMGAEEIGLLVAAATAVRALANPWIGSLADRRGDRRRMLIALSGATLFAYLLFAAADGFWALLAVTVLAALAGAAVLPLLDNLAVLHAHAGRIDYGRVRLWGSLAFILAATAGGAVLEGRPEALILWLAVGGWGLAFAASTLAPQAPKAPAHVGRSPLWLLLRDRRFLLFVATGSLLQASHAVYYGFATIHWRAAGIGEDAVGALWAVGVAAEIALFAVSGPIVARLGPHVLFAAAALAGVVRWGTLAATTDLGLLFAVQTLHALTFGATHLAAMNLIARTVPPAVSATAQTFYGGFAAGGAMALTSAAGGALYAAAQGRAFLAMAALSALGGLLALALSRASRAATA